MGKKSKPKSKPSRGTTIWIKNPPTKSKDTTESRIIESDKNLKNLKRQYIHEKIETDILKQRNEQFEALDKYEMLKNAYTNKRNRWIWE